MRTTRGPGGYIADGRIAEIGLEPVLGDGRQRIVHLEELVYATPALNDRVEAFDESDGPAEAILYDGERSRFPGGAR